MIRRIPLQGLKNTRDLGGRTTAEGKTVRRRMLLRSGELSKATPRDIRVLLNDYRLRLVIDLRMDAETETAPDPAIPGVRRLQFNLLDQSFFGIARDEVSVETWLSLFRDPSFSAEQVFSDMYFKLAFDERVRPMIREIFYAVAECDGAALWHCSAGKDRAGIVTMLFLFALGVDREEIIRDYLATLRFTFADVMKVRLLAPLKIRDRAVLKGANVLMGVDGAYLRRIFAHIDAHFSDGFDFFETQYGIPPELILRLRDKYLE